MVIRPIKIQEMRVDKKSDTEIPNEISKIVAFRIAATDIQPK